jgi:hypothetical protein
LSEILGDSSWLVQVLAVKFVQEQNLTCAGSLKNGPTNLNDCSQACEQFIYFRLQGVNCDYTDSLVVLN